LHEGDQKLSDEEAKRFLAEQVEDSRDSGILPSGFALDDLCWESVRAYRQTHQNLNPDHPWGNLEAPAFLEKIGAWKRDRMTGDEGLTRAGLLMFGTHPVIQQAFPHFMLDYQERPEAKTELRWVDRVTLDGSWSGNLYDFYRKVYPKLTADLKTPFLLEGGERKQETPVHVALREALVNALVHADYSGRASVLIVKRPDMFGFRNPGTMRIPVEVALQGGEPDCRNRLLHQMFRYIGLGEQSGSGVPKIMEGWRLSHWRPPQLYEKPEPYDQTIMELRMLDLFPHEVVSTLRKSLGPIYEQLGYEGQVAMALVLTENTVTHGRLAQVTGKHPTDLSRVLHRLVHDHGFLACVGSGRGAVYHLVGDELPQPDDVFGSGASSPLSDGESPYSGASSPLSDGNSPHSEVSSPSSEHPRDDHGRLISPHLPRRVIDDIDRLSKPFLEQLCRLADAPRCKGRVARETMRTTILALCRNQYVTLDSIAKIVRRNAKSLQNQYLSPMVKEKQLALAFPTKPNDPRQAYIAAQPPTNGLEGNAGG
jgi:predicted HTH transcriptional regulator